MIKNNSVLYGRFLTLIELNFLGIKLGERAGNSSSGISILQSISILLDIINENRDDYAIIDSCNDCLRLLGKRLEGMF